MRQTLMQGLTEKNMEATVNSYDLKPYYYPTLFPLKENFTLSWKGLEIMTGLKVAADIVARGASINRKTREALTRLQGDIPKIAVKRTMDEEQLTEYDIMLAMATGDSRQRALVEAWAKDTEFCWDAVAARIEWIALQSISRGIVTLDNDNNNSAITEYDIDYQLDADRKSGFNEGSASWATSESAKPISKDFKQAVDEAKKKGVSLRYAFMNLDNFALFAQTDEVIKLSSSYMQNALSMSQTPTPEQVNVALKNQAYLRGLQVVVIDQDITIEKDNGERITGNPFANNVVSFSDSLVLGNTYWKKPIDVDPAKRGSAAIVTMNQHTAIKKFANEEPIEEVTMGIANAFPAWLTSPRSYLMDTANSTWNEGVVE